MKSFKNIIMIGILFVCILNLFGNEKERNPTSVVLCAKTDEYETLEEISTASDIVVYGKKTYENEPTIIEDTDGNTFFTISEFEIMSIEKNSTEQPVFVGQKIPILENEAYIEEENTIYHVGGYNKMELGNEYVLLLYYAHGNGWYIPTGVNTGKIPKDENEIMANVNKSELEHLEEIAEEARSEIEELQE